MNMNLNNVNRRNTREWALFNGNSKGQITRDKIVEKHGGTWEKQGRYWHWNQNNFKLINFPKCKKPRTMFVFTSKDGISYITDNFEGFCKERSINSSAMHEVLSGKRKQFKGFVVSRLSAQDNGKKA